MATVLIVMLLVLTRAPALWWAVMALTIGAVVASELLNTALEALADHLHPQQHPAIGLSKDVAAGAVLVSSVAALVVGVAFGLDQVWPWVRAMLCSLSIIQPQAHACVRTRWQPSPSKAKSRSTVQVLPRRVCRCQ